MATVRHLGLFPFCVKELAEDGQPFEVWDGVTLFETTIDGEEGPSFPSKSSSKLITVYGNKTEYNFGLTLHELMLIYWRVSKYKITIDGDFEVSLPSLTHTVTKTQCGYSVTATATADASSASLLLPFSDEASSFSENESGKVCYEQFFLNIINSDGDDSFDDNVQNNSAQSPPPGCFTSAKAVAYQRVDAGITVSVGFDPFSDVQVISVKQQDGTFIYYPNSFFGAGSSASTLTEKSEGDGANMQRERKSNRVSTSFGPVPSGANVTLTIGFPWGDKDFTLPLYRFLIFTGETADTALPSIADLSVKLSFEYWPYDPNDGLGPIYDSATGEQLRPFPA
jgi:hypothetical protein